MTRTLAVVIAFAAVLGFGVAHGLWSDRWKLSNEPGASAAKLQNVSRTIGDWEGEDDEFPPQVVEMAELAGYINRRYLNRRTGVGVSVVLVCGRPGPISVHRPEVCFPGQGMDFSIPPGKTTVPCEALPIQPVFFHTRLTRANAPGTPPHRLLWAWSADGAWQAADNPRLDFARHDALFKLYVMRPMARAEEPLAEDPIQGFLRVFLPELQRALFTSSPGAPPADSTP
jgi:hypothetical protein